MTLPPVQLVSCDYFCSKLKANNSFALKHLHIFDRKVTDKVELEGQIRNPLFRKKNYNKEGQYGFEGPPLPSFKEK